MTSNAKFYLDGVVSRPDFRLVVTFIWGELDHVETNGDSNNPASRSWTWLIARTRSKPCEEFEIDTTLDDPCRLKVTGSSTELAARVAYFMARETGASVRAGGPNESEISLKELEAMVGRFSLVQAMEASVASIWRKATLSNPYPNLGSGSA